MLIFILNLLVFSLLGQNVKVHVKIQNDMNKEITIKIFKADAFGGNESLVEIYKIPPSDKPQEFDINDRFKKLESIVAKTVINGVNFNRETKLLVDKKNNFVYLIDNLKEENVKITDLLSLETILSVSKDIFLIPNDYSDKPINGLFTTYLGGIVIYNPKARKIEKEIWPSTLGYALKYTPDPNYYEHSYYLKIASGNSISTNIPAIAGLGLNFKTNSLIKTNILLKGKKTFDIGDIPITYTSIDQALVKMNDEIILNIGMLFLKNDSLEIRQIDRAIGIDCMIIELEELQEVGGDANLKLASAIFEGNRTYEKTSQNRKKILMGSSYFGFWSTNQGNAFPAFKEKSKRMATAYIKMSTKEDIENAVGYKIQEKEWNTILENTNKTENKIITKEDEDRMKLYALKSKMNLFQFNVNSHEIPFSGLNVAALQIPVSWDNDNVKLPEEHIKNLKTALNKLQKVKKVDKKDLNETYKALNGFESYLKKIDGLIIGNNKAFIDLQERNKIIR